MIPFRNFHSVGTSGLLLVLLCCKGRANTVSGNFRMDTTALNPIICYILEKVHVYMTQHAIRIEKEYVLIQKGRITKEHIQTSGEIR